MAKKKKKAQAAAGNSSAEPSGASASEAKGDDILRRLTRIGEGPRRPLEEFLRYAESVEEEQLKTVKGFLFDLFCKIYEIPPEELESDQGRLLRFRFFQELGRGATVEEIKEIFIRNLFSRDEPVPHPEGDKPAVPEKPPSLAARARNYIESHYSDRLSLQMLADHLNVCKEHLSRAFKREFGVTVTEHIHGVRIELAKSMVLENQLSLKEICYELGYQSYNDFYRNFRKLTGKSPKEFYQDSLG